MNFDREVIAATMLSRVRLYQQSEDEARESAIREWRENRDWFVSDSRKPGSFLWYCDQLALEPDAVLRELRK